MNEIGLAIRRVLLSNKTPRLALLAAILGWLALYKLPITSATTSVGVDGGYYASVALFVRDGRGLVTNVSLHHAGFPHFPHPTSVYPLWPLLWGYAARLFPLIPTGLWLATGCYMLSLVLGYLWANALAPRALFPSARFGPVDAGHVLVLMLGLSPQYFKFTSWPYTEALGFVLTFATLLRFQRLAPKPSIFGGMELGLWLGLCALCRAQLLLLAMAAVPTLFLGVTWVAGWRRRYATMLAAAVATFALVLLPHYLYVKSFVPGATLGTMFRFDQVRITEHLSPVATLKKSKDLADFLRDRATGFEAAFDPKSKNRYALQFYYYQWAPILALPLALASGVWAYSRRGLGETWRWLRRRERLPQLCVLALAIGAFLSTHAMHQSGGGWYFHSRQALPCMITFFLGMAWLMARAGAIGKLAAMGLLVLSTYDGVKDVRKFTTSRLAQPKTEQYEPLARWLSKMKQQRGKLTVAFRQPQMFAYQTPDIGYHSYHRGVTLPDIERMVTKLDVDLVLVARSASFESNRRFKEMFEKIDRRAGVKIYAPARGQGIEGPEDAEPAVEPTEDDEE